MSGIRRRVEDALLLWEHGHREGPLLQALVAVAATGRRRFPKSQGFGDRQAFESFLTANFPWRISLEYRGDLHSLESIFYKWFRCELVHEGGLPVDVEFMTDVEPGDLVVRAGGAPEYVLQVSPGWFHKLLDCLTHAPENQDCFR